MKNVDEVIRALPAKRRKKIEQRAAELIAEESARQKKRPTKKALKESKLYKSPALAAVHEMMSDLQKAGLVDDQPCGSLMSPASN